ncbi:GNAT family N-acetyltransferase [Aliiroseovarius sp. PTFE2010]|uniref:GNAT family N-acetyltransferase n=1 Tax=Aliiroseovarius sp. PTFE2010 TaxID=3417190 RepID=UPI003CF5EE8C
MTEAKELTRIPVIETDRFVLRPMRPSDAGLLSLYAGDERVARNTTRIPHPYPPGAAEAFIARSLELPSGAMTWALDGSAANLSEVLGTISLRPMDRGQSEIGYWVAPAFWGTGIASSAVRAVVSANPFADQTFFATVFQDNAASARVVTNNGFEYLGEAEAYSVARQATVPTWTYLRKLG